MDKASGMEPSISDLLAEIDAERDPSEKSVGELLDELANDSEASEARQAVCKAVGDALTRAGHIFWLTGYIAGTDRKTGASPYGYGNDGAVGLATVAQIGGELANGAAQLLECGNLYGASALVRQLVEVEYLARAFEHDNSVAAEWLRADREARRKFWSPERLRKRSEGHFLRTDYWHHCDRGGHPTREAMSLLPGHSQIASGYLWTDFANHLVSVWRSFCVGAERLMGDRIEDRSESLADVHSAIEHWRRTDGLNAALSDLDRIRRE